MSPIFAVVTLFVATWSSVVLAQQAPSLDALQGKSLAREKAQSDLIMKHYSIENRLTDALPAYIRHAVATAQAKGVRFSNTESLMNDKLDGQKLMGNTEATISYLNIQKTIGNLQTGRGTYYVLPLGAEPIEVRESGVDWRASTSACQFSILFKEHPWVSGGDGTGEVVGNYPCDDFLSGKSDVQFSRTFESALRMDLQDN
jgi:hypothetical protein